MKFAYPDWLTCKKSLLGGHGKARRTVIIQNSSKFNSISLYFQLLKFLPQLVRRCKDIPLVSTGGV